MHRPAELLLCLALLATALPALAEKADKDKPVNLEADSLRVDDASRTAVYEGHVVLTQGSLMLTADRIEVRQDGQGFASGDASGKPAYFRQKMDGRNEYAEGWAERIEYDSRAEKLRLTGQARLKRGEEELRGNLIAYEGKSGFYQAQGGNGRVRAVIRPKSLSGGTAVKP
ncbi:MAG: lipopolysaccharide transport periplasmic protein LptA [Pseudomonadota bacterium]